ncbi:MAG: DNA methyltransferase [Planctomycetota bacterium]
MTQTVLHVKPISRTIRPLRQATARHYGSHPYFTRRPWNVVQAYIKNFTKPGDTVLDPFGGSGVTAIESLVLRRRAIHVDINPLANFIAKEIAIAPVDLDTLSRTYHAILDACRPQIDSWRRQPNSFFEHNPVPYWYPRSASLPRNADVKYVEDLFTRRQLFVLSLLLDRIAAVRNPTSRDLLRFCFSATLAKTNRTFISARNRAETRGGPSIFSIYRYNVPSQPVELDPWTQFQERFSNLMHCKKETNHLIGSFYSEEDCLILHGSAARLPRSIAPASVAYVFTDPPYGGHIAYLDLSTMWNEWLRLTVSSKDREAEMIEGGDNKHTRDHYLSLLDQSVSEIARVLKPGGWLSIVFEHSDGSLYAAILDAAKKHGLTYSNAVAQSLDVVWSMHKKKHQKTVLSGELILNFCKSHSVRPTPHRSPRPTLSQLVVRAAQSYCGSNGGATTEEIFNDVMRRAIDSGMLDSIPVTLRDIFDLLVESGYQYDRHSRRWRHKSQPPSPQDTLF